MGKLQPTKEATAALYENLAPGDVRKYALYQMQWYERKAKLAKAWHWWLKTVEIVAAASIPVIVLLPGYETDLLVAALGALVTVLEAFQQFFRFRDSWLNFRSTAEAIRRDLLLFGTGSAPFADAPDRNRMLAERLAALTAEENTKWVEYSRQATEKDGQDGSASQSSTTSRATSASPGSATSQETAITQPATETSGEGI
ncbi:MAG TPA: DUF4231 domain-containing protein [Longimicrobium sp.]|jgi:hypothetical protein